MNASSLKFGINLPHEPSSYHGNLPENMEIDVCIGKKLLVLHSIETRLIKVRFSRLWSWQWQSKHAYLTKENFNHAAWLRLYFEHPWCASLSRWFGNLLITCRSSMLNDYCIYQTVDNKSNKNTILKLIYSSSFSTRCVGEYNKVRWRTDAFSWERLDARSTVPCTGDEEYRKIRLLGGYFSAIKIVIICSLCVRSFCLFIPFCPPNDDTQLHSTSCLVI